MNPSNAPQRILQGSTAVARAVLLDQDGNRDETEPTVTADVYDYTGAVSGSTNRTVTHNSDTGNMQVSLTASETANLRNFEIQWKRDGVVVLRSHVRIVGGFFFSRDELRDERGIGSSFSDAALDRARDWISEVIDWHTGAAWQPRFEFDEWNEQRTHREITARVLECAPARALVAVTSNGASVSLGSLEVDYDAAIVRNGHFYGPCSVAYECGFDGAPDQLAEAALIGAADRLLRSKSGISDRIRSRTNPDTGLTENWGYAGKDHPTGVDFVDSAIHSHCQRAPHF